MLDYPGHGGRGVDLGATKLRTQDKPPARTEPRPPMVCVKLPLSVLVHFLLFRATKLPFLRINGQQMNHFESSPLGASLSGLRVDKAASYRRMSILTAHDAIYASGPRGTSTPNLPTGSSPKGEHGRAPLQSRRGSKVFFFLCFLLLKIISTPQTTGFGAEPQVETTLRQHF